MVSKEMTLKAQLRTESGTKHSARLRAAGKIPAVIYGHGQTPESIAIDRHAFTEALHHGHRLLDVDIEGKSGKLLVKDLQYDYLGKDIIHADLIRVSLTEKVKVEVPIVFKGTAKGVAEGGLIEDHLDAIEIECLVTEIPESVEISIKDLAIGDSIHAKDIVLASALKMVTDPESLIVVCQPPKIVTEEAEEAAEGAEPASPEVITERKTEEQESEG